MKIEVFLFGKKENCSGWCDFLDLEKIPFQYKGESFVDTGRINILAGDSRLNVPKKESEIYLIEPRRRSGLCTVSDMQNVSVHGNVVRFNNNISSNLTQDYSFNGFQELYLQREFSIGRMREGLLKAFSLASLPYVHLWYYPFQSPTVLLFRQDIDYVNKKSVRKLLRLTNQLSVKGTYFINVSGEEEYDELIGHLKLKKPTTPARNLSLKEVLASGNELANHGYWHYVFDDTVENSKNIRKGRAYLKRIFGITAEGFASPGGEWNKNLLRALEINNLLYACNGCSDVVGFPFHPRWNRKIFKFLELVFYKICDGSFESEGGDAACLTSQEIGILSDILESYADGQIKENKPIAIMGHPHLSGNFAERVYLPVLKRLKKLGVPAITLSNFSKWWTRREDMGLDYSIGDGALTINTTEPAFIRMIYKGKKKIMKINKELILRFP